MTPAAVSASPHTQHAEGGAVGDGGGADIRRSLAVENVRLGRTLVGLAPAVVGASDYYRMLATLDGEIKMLELAAARNMKKMMFGDNLCSHAAVSVSLSLMASIPQRAATGASARLRQLVCERRASRRSASR